MPDLQARPHLTSPDHQRYLAALSQVADPEIGENIVELGLVERIESLPGRLCVTLVPTSLMCPMADVLVEQAGEALRAMVPATTEVEVDIDWDAQWTPQRMSPALRERLGW